MQASVSGTETRLQGALYRMSNVLLKSYTQYTTCIRIRRVSSAAKDENYYDNQRFFIIFQDFKTNTWGSIEDADERLRDGDMPRTGPVRIHALSHVASRYALATDHTSFRQEVLPKLKSAPATATLFF